MNIKLLLPGLTLSVLFLAEPAAAQVRYARPGYNRISRPTVSPYINLARRNVSPAISYYGIVRPEIALRQSVSRLGQDLTTIETESRAAREGELPATGHSSSFMNFSHFYPNMRGNSPTTLGRRGGAGRPPTYQSGATPNR